MKVAGAHGEVFTPSAVRRIFKVSRGIPRLINIVADRALLAAYTQDKSKIDSRLVRQSAAEVFGKLAGRRWWPWAVATAGVAAFAMTTVTYYDAENTNDPQFAKTALRGSDALAATDAASQTGIDPPSAQPDVDSGAGEPVFESRLLASLLGSPDFPTDPITATRELFRLWNANYDPNRGTACTQAESQQLKCLFLSRGSLGELRRLNRPVILTLTDTHGDRHQVVLTGLDYSGAVLSVGDRRERIDIAELTHYWYGENLLLWKPMVQGIDLAPGTRGDAVGWLRESMRQVLNVAVPSDDPLYFDAELAETVREFQRRNRLTVDAVVGAQTQIVIQTALHLPDVPKLSEDL
jgi:general secretion pathway protein A